VSLSLLARLLEYPGPDYGARLHACLEGQSGLSDFAAKVGDLPFEAVQELYTQTFDWNPDTTLDIGWHLFGENYDRGDFLVKLRGAMREYGLPESGELPDHLSHVLPLLERMPAGESAAFAERFVLPALGKLAAGLEKTESAFLPVVCAIREQVTATIVPLHAGASQ
jgi:nitrate reductase delta subunit